MPDGSKLAATPKPVYALSIHADYRCRHSGACCTAGWRIPLDAACERGLADAADRGQLPRVELQRRGSVAVLPLTSTGGCVFYREASLVPTRIAASGDAFQEAAAEREGRCAVHAAVGHQALPLACRQFPRVSLTDSRGTFVTLSHFCPTAAAQLFRNDVALGIVENRAAFPQGAEYVGLDAGDALPPLLRPDMLMDLASFARWERTAIAVLADPRRTAEEALGCLALFTERVRDWRPSDGSLSGRVDRASAARDETRVRSDGAHAGCVVSASIALPPDDRLRAHLALVNGVLPEGFTSRALPPDHAAIDVQLVAPGWVSFGHPVRRYLAARLFGSWLAYQGRGLRTMVRALEVALSVLRLECIRACSATRRPLDRELFTIAVRESDRLLVHEMSSLAFARCLSAREDEPLVSP